VPYYIVSSGSKTRPTLANQTEQFYAFPVLQHHIYSNAEVQAEYIKRILCSLTVTLERIFDMQSYNSIFKTINESSETSHETGNEVFGSPY
jgi:hypothetical protein